MNLPSEKRWDLLVAGSTPGGIAMALRAAREGLSVLLTNPHPHPGGLLASGLAVWDTLYEGRRSPIYDEVRQAIFDHYRTTYGEDSQEYREALPGRTGHTNGKFEARVAEAIFRERIAREPGLVYLTPFEPVNVERAGSRITAVTFRETEGSRSFRAEAEIVADCTYEGDLMALCGVPYAVGREPRDRYGEPHAGRLFMQNFPPGTPPVEASIAGEIARLDIRHFGGPQRRLEGPGEGEGDALVQAINYRTMLSSDPENRVLPEKPADYDPAFYATLEYGSRVTPVPHHKMGWNRPQLVGIQTDYIEADRAGRRRVLDAHWKATLGLLYYLQNDAPLSPEERAYWRQYGLARDEFPDNGHRPYEIYLREARRLKGRAVFTEHDGRSAPGITRPPIRPDSIALTEWYFDTHACTRDRVEGSLEEGKMMLHQETLPGQVAWRCLLSPELDNLLVPVCLSASHVGWGSIRLEPTWMHVAESAAWAAVLARRGGIDPAALDPEAVLRTLAEHGIALAFFNDVDVALGEAWVPAVEYFATKGFFPGYHARPEAPLSRAVASVWKEIARDFNTPGFDATRAAARVAVAETQPSEPATGADVTGSAGSAGANAPLSRAEACRLLYTALPQPPFSSSNR